MTVSSPEQGSPQRRSYLQKLWVPVVLLAGLVAGEAISLAANSEPGQLYEGGPFGHLHPFPTSPLFEYHVILTTVEVALLISLVIVYSRMYVETKANFALGLVAVLAALLIQTLVSYPVTESAIGPVTLPGPGYSTFAADAITICAYTVFLYLSLE